MALSRSVDARRPSSSPTAASGCSRPAHPTSPRAPLSTRSDPSSTSHVSSNPLCVSNRWRRYIVSGDNAHHFFLVAFKEAYPDAKLIGTLGHEEKRKELKFDGGEHISVTSFCV